MTFDEKAAVADLASAYGEDWVVGAWAHLESQMRYARSL